jgi:hypothetical protein
MQVHKVLMAMHAKTIKATTLKWLHTKNPPPSPLSHLAGNPTAQPARLVHVPQSPVLD